MSSGKEHQAASENLSWIAGFAAVAATGDLFAGFAAGVGCLAGIFLTPDLDVGYWARIRSMREIKKEFPLLGRVWHVMWVPYAFAIPHRSPWSHWPVVGTAVRLFYLSFVGAMLSLSASAMWGLELERTFEIYGLLAQYSLTHWFTVGLIVSDTAHWLMDHGV